MDTFNMDEQPVDVPLAIQPMPADDQDRVAEALECLQRARVLLKAADCKRTLARVDLAVSSAMGAVRNVGYRAARAARAAAEAVAVEAPATLAELVLRENFEFSTLSITIGILVDRACAAQVLAIRKIERGDVTQVACGRYPRDARECWVSTDSLDNEPNPSFVRIF